MADERHVKPSLDKHKKIYSAKILATPKNLLDEAARFFKNLFKDKPDGYALNLSFPYTQGACLEKTVLQGGLG